MFSAMLRRTPAQPVAAEPLPFLLRGAFHIAAADQPILGRTAQGIHVHAQLPGQLAHRRRGADRHMLAGRGRGADKKPVFLAGPATFEAPDHGAGIRLAFVAEQGFADMQDVARRAIGFRHHAVIGRGNVHQGLGGFHRHQQLIGLDRIAGPDVPFDNLRFLQAFAQIGQFEIFHRSLLRRSSGCCRRREECLRRRGCTATPGDTAAVECPAR
ncbi:hypothetical protein ACVWWS_005227 [Pseudomonas chlororaphis]